MIGGAASMGRLRHVLYIVGQRLSGSASEPIPGAYDIPMAPTDGGGDKDIGKTRELKFGGRDGHKRDSGCPDIRDRSWGYY
ncbi:MAG: hypothetical protein OXU25_08470 [Thaumarchaeota archaeon]|nr:hypothetical protein [Nitrososphaerota archaeon]